MSYKNILSGYVNPRQEGVGHYLVITNLTEEDVVIKAGEKLYMNRTPKETLDKHPKVPHYSKSVKVEMSEQEVKDVNNDVPF